MPDFGRGAMSSVDELVYPNATSFATLLENRLTQIIRLHSLKLLNKEESLLFIRPECTTPRQVNLEAERNTRHGQNLPPFRLKSFIHPSLLKGIEVWAEGYPAVIMLRESTGSRVEMKWLVRWEKGGQSGNFRDFASIVESKSGTKKANYSSLIMYYQRAEDQVWTLPASLELTFKTVEQAELCLLTFQALSRIEKESRLPVRPRIPPRIWRPVEKQPPHLG